MHWIFHIVAFFVIALSASFVSAGSNVQTVGLFLNEEDAFDGYTLFGPIGYHTTYLIDNDGNLVHSWESERLNKAAPYLLENGNLLHISGIGRVEELTWEGELVWEFQYVNDEHLLHHDIEVLPNGNVLMIALEYKTAPEAIAAGRNPDLLADGQLWVDHVIEVERTGPSGGNIVWEWHSWDHLVQDYDPEQDNFGTVADHAELIDLNYVDSALPASGRADWHHSNSVDYNEEFDQIVVNVRHFNEFWVIDHSTTTEEAAGHTGGNSEKGGDILYRWGNPQTYGAGDASDQKFFFQHDARWIDSDLPGAENILVFNNGDGRPGGNHSSVDELVPPVDGSGNYPLTPGQAYGPTAQLWTYEAPTPADFYATFISGAERLPNGNTLVNDGPAGTLFEVTADGAMVWRYVNPVTESGPLRQGDIVTSESNMVFRAPRYAPDFPGLQGRDLTPGGPVELPKPPGQPLGDVNDDGLVTSVDALLVLQFNARLLPTLPDLAISDVDGSGDTTAIDAALILQFTAGLLEQLPP